MPCCAALFTGERRHSHSSPTSRPVQLASTTCTVIVSTQCSCSAGFALIAGHMALTPCSQSACRHPQHSLCLKAVVLWVSTCQPDKRPVCTLSRVPGCQDESFPASLGNDHNTAALQCKLLLVDLLRDVRAYLVAESRYESYAEQVGTGQLTSLTALAANRWPACRASYSQHAPGATLRPAGVALCSGAAQSQPSSQWLQLMPADSRRVPTFVTAVLSVRAASAWLRSGTSVPTCSSQT